VFQVYHRLVVHTKYFICYVMQGGFEMEDKWRLHIVSHTHWDREWYMSFQKYRRRFVKLMDYLLALFEEKKDYRFFTMDGQILVIKDYLEIRPEKAEKIKQLVTEGRLLIGPWYSQPNEFMAGGEAMIRNLILGIRESRQLGGVMKVCYLPDAFGHISQLPQLIKGFGMEDVVVWRGIPVNRKTVFSWTGADSSKCLLFYLCCGYGNAKDLPIQENDYAEYIDDTLFEREGLEKRVESIIASLSPRATNPNLLLLNGVDHSFAQYDLPEVVNKINDKSDNVVAVHSNLPEYIESVREYHKKTSLPFEQMAGEMRDSSESHVLEGSQSTRSDVKIINSRIEGMFEKWMEPFAAYAWTLGVPYPENEIWKAWEYLLQNHAHDSMACSSVDSTYHQVLTRFEWAEELGQEIVEESLQKICNQIVLEDKTGKRDKVLALFNPLCWKRSEVITTTLDIPKALGIVNPKLMDECSEVPFIVNSKREAVIVKFNPRRGHPDAIPVERYEVSFKAVDIPANGYKALSIQDSKCQRHIAGSLVKNNNTMENEHLRVKINRNGTLDILDKRSGKEYPSLHFFQNSGEAGNGFEHKAPEKDKVVFSTGIGADISVVKDTALEAVFRTDIELMIPKGLNSNIQSRSEETVSCKISSLLTLKTGAARVDIETRIDNRAFDHWLRVVFPSGIQTDLSYAEQPFDVVERNVKTPDFNNFPHEKPSQAHPQLSFVDVSDKSFGLMIANQGLYEYEVIDNEDRSIALSLLRCTDRLYGGCFAVSEETRIPEAQCLGQHIFYYSIIPHKGTWQDAYREAYTFNYPLKAVIQNSLEEETLVEYKKKSSKVFLSSQHSFINIKPNDLIISAVKKCENRDSLIIRLFNPTEDAIEGSVELSFPEKEIKEAYKTNLNEEREEKLSLYNGCVDLHIRSKGLQTVELT